MTQVTVTERWHLWNGLRYRVWERPVPGSATPPLVLIHGYAACVEQWGRFIRDIGPDVPVYAVDLIGFGASDKPRDAAYGRVFYLAQLEHLRRAYGLARVVAVGHSLGGMLAIEWAAEQPDAIASVIALAPGGLLSGDELRPWQESIVKKLATPALTRLLFGVVAHLPYRLLSAPAYADRAAMEPYTQAALKRALHSPGAVWSYSAVFRNQAAFHIVADTATVRCPLHVIWGTRDVQVSRADIATLAGRSPHSTLTELDGGGHCIHEERAREVAAEVRALLVTDGLLDPIPAPLIVAT
ncbi:MAG: alpha/beta hydrolase [Thermomicrobia bacterium]|nr:alpha/beta hydrolase [Thermomicrobia bacterium]